MRMHAAVTSETGNPATGATALLQSPVPPGSTVLQYVQVRQEQAYVRPGQRAVADVGACGVCLGRRRTTPRLRQTAASSAESTSPPSSPMTAPFRLVGQWLQARMPLARRSTHRWRWRVALCPPSTRCVCVLMCAGQHQPLPLTELDRLRPDAPHARTRMASADIRVTATSWVREADSVCGGAGSVWW